MRLEIEALAIGLGGAVGIIQVTARFAEGEEPTNWGWTNDHGQVIFTNLYPGTYVFEVSNPYDSLTEVIPTSAGWASLDTNTTYSDTLTVMPLKANTTSGEPFSLLDIFYHLDMGLQDYDFSHSIDYHDLKKLLEQLPPVVGMVYLD